MCVQKDNWQEAPEFYERALSMGVGVEFQYVHYDPSNSVSLNLEPQEKKMAIKHYLSSNLPPKVIGPVIRSL